LGTLPGFDELEGGRMQKIGVLGAGTMGAGIAQAFEMAGKDVVLRDITDALVE